MDKSHPSQGEQFVTRKWRRRYIESYLVFPPALSRASGTPEDEIRRVLQDDFALAVGDSFQSRDVPKALMDVHAKEILARFNVSAVQVAKSFTLEEVCADVLQVLDQLGDFAKED